MEEIDLRELFDYFKTKLMWILITVLLIVGLGNMITILTRVPMYNSNTTVVLVSKNGAGENSYNTSQQQLNKNLVGTYSQIVKSRKVLEDVIANLSLKCSYEDLYNRVSVEAVTDTEIIKIIVRDANPKKATKIANEIAKVFIIEIQKIYKLDNISVIDKAQDNIKPYNVNYVKDNAIYILLGVVLSSGVIFVFFYFDTTIKTSEEIENKLGLTILGVVPKVEGE